MRAVVLQPTYLPWMGYFELIDATDVYVVFDHVQFVKKGWQQRNRIKTPNGVIWLTIPVKKAPRGTRICDIEISWERENPLEKHWETIAFGYGKAPYFNKYKFLFEEIYSKRYTLLRDLNVELIKTICNILGIKTKILFSSELNLSDEDMGKTEKIVNLCKKVGITYLYDGKSAQDFIDLSLFEKEKIQIAFQDFHHPTYPQRYGDFIPYMSVIDLLLNTGEDAISYIREGGKEALILDERTK